MRAALLLPAGLAAGLAACAVAAVTACSPAPTHGAHRSLSPVAAPYPSTRPAASRPVAGGLADRTGHLLIGAADLGPGYGRATAGAPMALACTPGAPTVDDRLAHVSKAAVAYVDDVAGVQVGEQIYVYPDRAGAREHEQLLAAGLACAHGTIRATGHQTAVTVTGPADLHQQLAVHNDAAQRWGLDSDRFGEQLIVVRTGPVVVQVTVVTEPGTTPQLDVVQIVEASVSKVLATAGTG